MEDDTEINDFEHHFNGKHGCEYVIQLPKEDIPCWTFNDRIFRRQSDRWKSNEYHDEPIKVSIIDKPMDSTTNSADETELRINVMNLIEVQIDFTD